MSTKIKLCFLAVMLIFISGHAQNRDYARNLIDSLASPFMFGRGYVKQGDSLAAAFIASQFKDFGLQHFEDDYHQHFTLNVNTFPGEMSIEVNGNSLIPGTDFSVSAASHGDEGLYKVKRLTRRNLENHKQLQRLIRRDHSEYYIYYDVNLREIKPPEKRRPIDSLIRNNVVGSRGAIYSRPTISWHAWSWGLGDEPFTSVDILRDKTPRRFKTINLNVESNWIENYPTRNVIGWIPGKTQPDSFLVVTAHYDHIGMMGKETVFPGANDNASGTAMLIDLARHYSQPENQPDYSMAFMAFAAEETGLLGSRYYTENPYFPLEQIKFLINLDMVGTGSEGLLVFNGTTDTVRFEVMNRINEQHKYLKEIRMRGVSRSSDHYYFYAKGVPAFFLLTFGSEHRHYHNIWDTREALPLTKYDEVFRLITDFFDTF